MAYDVLEQLKTISRELNELKKEALNRDDTRFEIWHQKAREAVVRYTPLKLPAFDEILFASDFFISKPATERDVINDRIALVSDCNLANQILEEVVLYIKTQESRRRQSVLKNKASAYGLKESISPLLEKVFYDLEPGWEKLDHLLEMGSFADREKMEAKETLQNLQRSLSGNDSDWDQLKRGIKFLLEFDRHLAVEAIPFLLSLYQSKQGPGRG